MSTGLRDQRVAVYGYQDVGQDGMPASQYTRVNSGQPDHAFWARKEPASAREAMVAQQAQHEVSWVFAFGDSVSIPPDGVLKHLPSGDLYKVTGVYPTRMLREVRVHAIEAEDEVYNRIVENP